MSQRLRVIPEGNQRRCHPPTVEKPTEAQARRDAKLSREVAWRVAGEQRQLLEHGLMESRVESLGNLTHDAGRERGMIPMPVRGSSAEPFAEAQGQPSSRDLHAYLMGCSIVGLGGESCWPKSQSEHRVTRPASRGSAVDLESLSQALAADSSQLAPDSSLLVPDSSQPVPDSSL